MNIIGKKIREIRMAKGLTQEQLATACCLLGFDLSRGTLAKVESQNRQVTDYEIRYFAKALNVAEGDFFAVSNQ
ncbi:transcriptional regulator [Psychromonas marina]|uniref:Transcriptional regulator n=1 Tax=Psychromonas marina TaxID=88364 RepID=A0ABQ6E401_9GAMM|nr:helix-turn-helix transcriptional regulator [Psychromonas marina]GLS91974.1 transcriptional regulator [Psychromonas marina]